MSTSQGKLPARTIRVPEDLWLAAVARAAERGESVSEAVRKFLVRYTKERK